MRFSSFQGLICSATCTTIEFMSDKKHPTSIRLSDEAKRLQKRLSQKLGVSQAAVLELALRALAQRENVK
jgi:hypothetical protein